MNAHAPAADSKTHPHPPQSSSARGPDWWLMMKKFWSKGRSIASFAPSSRFMARSVVGGIDFDSARCIVELGAGTGPITAELVRRLRPQTKLLVIELDPDLCARLRARFPQVDVVQGDACQFDKLLADRGHAQVDHVCSGLPLPSFPAPLRDAILATSARMLAPGGTFRQLTVMPLIYYRMYRSYFEDVRFRFVPLNMPPGGVYVCRGYREPAAV
ncbi:MAG: ermA1 [Gemmataceae bacterium]|nr:ermA1 [Gemmataceae bacterium]